MKYTPLNDYVIIEKLPSNQATSSGIILTSAVTVDNAKILAVAKTPAGLPLCDLQVDQVVMLRWSNALKIDGNVYAVSVKEIVCVLN